MKKIETSIEGVYIIEPDCFGDNRGYFMETYNENTFKVLGINNKFVQDNMSFSALKGTLRGLHFQINPFAQAKLVRCNMGEVIDVAIDLRKGSKTYLKYESCLLTGDNKRMFFIPRGFAHGFLTLTDNVQFQYKCDNFYNKESEGSIIYNDPTINIDWSKFLGDIKLVLSAKDLKAPRLEECVANFKYGE